MKRIQMMTELTWPDDDPRTPQELKDGIRQTLEGCLAADGGGAVVYLFVTSAMQDPPFTPQPPDGF